jgi:hypothetical protein
MTFRDLTSSLPLWCTEIMSPVLRLNPFFVTSFQFTRTSPPLREVEYSLWCSLRTEVPLDQNSHTRTFLERIPNQINKLCTWHLETRTCQCIHPQWGFYCLDDLNSGQVSDTMQLNRSFKVSAHFIFISKVVSPWRCILYFLQGNRFT